MSRVSGIEINNIEDINKQVVYLEKFHEKNRLEFPPSNQTQLFTEYLRLKDKIAKSLEELSKNVKDTYELTSALLENIDTLDVKNNKKPIEQMLKAMNSIYDQTEEELNLINSDENWKLVVTSVKPDLINDMDKCLEVLSDFIENMELGLKYGKEFKKLGDAVEKYNKTAKKIEVKDLFD